MQNNLTYKNNKIVEQFSKFINEKPSKNISCVLYIFKKTRFVNIDEYITFNINKHSAKKIKFFPKSKYRYIFKIVKKNNKKRLYIFKNKKNKMSINSILSKLIMLDPTIIFNIEQILFDKKG